MPLYPFAASVVAQSPFLIWINSVGAVTLWHFPRTWIDMWEALEACCYSNGCAMKDRTYTHTASHFQSKITRRVQNLTHKNFYQISDWFWKKHTCIKLKQNGWNSHNRKFWHSIHTSRLFHLIWILCLYVEMSMFTTIYANIAVLSVQFNSLPHDFDNLDCLLQVI